MAAANGETTNLSDTDSDSDSEVGASRQQDASAPANKRSKTGSLLSSDILASDLLDRQERIRASFAEGRPYPHAQIHGLFQPDFLTAVKDEIKSQTKVNFKESDLFRVYQSIDLANLEPCTTMAAELPHVMKLRELLYSQEWRTFIEKLSGLPPGTLTGQIDCACNCHAPGCHLLCHDDVIGTRKISYIIYMTEPDWKPEEGGALELYEPQLDDSLRLNDTPASSSSSSPLPVARAWPVFNSMAFFVVDPGHSFHAVQEVIGNRPRLSLQGWYHAKHPPENIELATLQQLKARKQQQRRPNLPKANDAVDADDDEKNENFSELDKIYLQEFIQAEYLTEASMTEIRKRFEKDSSVQLRNFLQPKWVPTMEPQKMPLVYDEAYYSNGVSPEWQLRGPAHKQRFLEYVPNAVKANDCQMIGSLLNHLKKQVFESEAMARYLKHLTGLGKPTGISGAGGQIRRFRPGLDYTVAHYGLLVDESVLDATICFVYEDNDEQDAWESGDVGGFECYIEADDDEGQVGGGAGANGPADEYNEDDDTELLSVSASNNTLSLVYRDPGTMRFVKYVGASAPSSRYDICMEYEVPPGDDGIEGNAGNAGNSDNDGDGDDF